MVEQSGDRVAGPCGSFIASEVGFGEALQVVCADACGIPVSLSDLLRECALFGCGSLASTDEGGEGNGSGRRR